MTYVPFRFLLPLGVLAVLCVPAFTPASAAFDPSRDPHSHFRRPERCPVCHRNDGPGVAPSRFTAASVDFCLSCHRVGERGRTHAFKVPPGDGPRRITVPGAYPLSDDGKIMCLTCHTAHGAFLSTSRAFAGQRPENPDAPAGSARYYRTYYLRRTDPSGEGFQPLCRGCHPAL